MKEEKRRIWVFGIWTLNNLILFVKLRIVNMILLISNPVRLDVYHLQNFHHRTYKEKAKNKTEIFIMQQIPNSRQSKKHYYIKTWSLPSSMILAMVTSKQCLPNTCIQSYMRVCAQM